MPFPSSENYVSMYGARLENLSGGLRISSGKALPSMESTNDPRCRILDWRWRLGRSWGSRWKEGTPETLASPGWRCLHRQPVARAFVLIFVAVAEKQRHQGVQGVSLD